MCVCVCVCVCVYIHSCEREREREKIHTTLIFCIVNLKEVLFFVHTSVLHTLCALICDMCVRYNLREKRPTYNCWNSSLLVGMKRIIWLNLFWFVCLTMLMYIMLCYGFRPNCFTWIAHLYLYYTLLIPHTYASYIRHWCIFFH